ncbi:MAG: copper homeostasis protein CutC [Gemmatimonadales bacterium]|jgi:copper homeostasis protein|nr:MAG: copper homeostasis protein CutC [Gemmatimonadales bacterium]
MMPSVLLEACVETLSGAIAAEEGGARRVELCVTLEVGGLTPPDALIAECVRHLSIPVFVLARPVPGPFVLSSSELDRLLGDIRMAADRGAAGVVAGALTMAGTIDERALEAIVAAAGPLPVTFHRAFDAAADQLSALDVLARVGVARVLTSGGAATAAKGAARIRALVEQAAGRIGILAGGSVRAHNAAALVQATGVTEIHSRTTENPAAVHALVTAANGA